MTSLGRNLAALSARRGVLDSPVRRGRVKKVDNSGLERIVTIQGRRMPTIDDSIGVDDVAFWLTGPSPVCLGKVVPGDGEAVTLPTGSFNTAADYFTEFSTTGDYTVLGSDYEVYDGIGNAGFGIRSPANVNVVTEATSTSGGNVLQLRANNTGGQHYHAGVKLLRPRTYMQVELRVRVGDDASALTSGVVIFWPSPNPVLFPDSNNASGDEGEWPAGGELDFWETYDNRTTRTPTQYNIHRLNPTATPLYTQADDQVPYAGTFDGVDQSDWHKIVCSWEPTEIAIEVDDGAKQVLTDDVDAIPDWDMDLTLQIDAWSDTPPGSTVDMEIDYILVRDWVED